MGKILAAIIFFFFLIVFVSPVRAAGKILPQARSSVKTVSRPSSGITITPKLRADRKAVFIYFGNLQNASTVSYALIYQTNNQEERAGGEFMPSGNSTSREILFGTCSKNVCRYHQNITNTRLEISSVLKSGKKSLKRYRIKV